MKVILVLIFLCIFLVGWVVGIGDSNHSYVPVNTSSQLPTTTSQTPTSIIALIISFVALFIGVWGLWLQRWQNELLVRPLGVIDYSWDEKLGKSTVCIRNAGNGPMIVKSIKIEKQGKIIDITKTGIDRDDVIPKGIICKCAYDLEDYPINPGGSHLIYKCDRTEQTRTIENIDTILNGLTIVMDYTDIFNKIQPEYRNILSQYPIEE